MTIEYKDSKRIVALSSDVLNTPTYSDFTGTWTTDSGNEVQASNGVVSVNMGGSNRNDYISFDLGSTLSDSWTLRFKQQATTNSFTLNSGNAGAMYVSLSSGTNLSGEHNDGGSVDSINTRVRHQSTQWKMETFDVRSRVSGTTTSSGDAGQVLSTGAQTYYVEVIKDGATTSVKYFDDSGFSSQVGTTKSVSSNSIGTNLQYLGVHIYSQSHSSGDFVAQVSEFKIYDGVTSLTNKPTNVQDNSLFVEKDVARRYWFSEAPAPTFEDDFSGADNWTDSGSTPSVNTSTDVIDFESATTNNIKAQTTYDLTSTSDTKWVLRCKLNVTTFTQPSTEYHRFFIGLSSSTSNLNTSEDAIGLKYELGAGSLDRLVAIDTNGSTIRATTGDNFTHTSAVETLYVEIVRQSATTYDVNLRSGSHSGTLVEAKTGLTTGSGTTGLRYIKIASYSDHAGNGELSGTIDDVEFYNDVTTPTPATWNVPSKTPAEIGDLKVHYDATVGVTASSNSVSAWADQSGNGKTLSSVSNPTRVEAGQNGKDYIDFNSSKSMRASGLSEDVPRPFSMVIVINPRNTSNQSIIRWGQSPYLALYQYPANTYYISGGSDVGLSDSTLDGSWNAFFMDFKSDADGGTLQINLDTANAVSGDIGDNGTSGSNSQPSTLHVGVNGDNNNWYASCRYAEIIMFDKVLTAYEKEQLYGHLKTKWGLP